MICSAPAQRHAVFRRFAPLAMALALSVLATGCQTTSPFEATGSIGPNAAAAAAAGETDWRRSVDAWGERHRANPADPDAAINYAQALRGYGQRAQAVA